MGTSDIVVDVFYVKSQCLGFFFGNHLFQEGPHVNSRALHVTCQTRCSAGGALVKQGAALGVHGVSHFSLRLVNSQK